MLCALMGVFSAKTQTLIPPGGQVFECGINIVGRADALNVLSNTIAVSANATWSLALKSDGTLYGWGPARFLCSDTPPGAYKSMSAGWKNGIAIKLDGTVVEWGTNSFFWSTPALQNVVQVAAGDLHSAALLANGRLETWGDQGRPSVLSMSGVITDAVQIASGWYHIIAARSNGTVTTFGDSTPGQDNTVPAGLTDVVAVFAGPFNNFALKSDGTVVGWGLNDYGQSTPPPGLTDVVQIAAGRNHTLALKSDGTVVGWGDNSWGQLNIPTEWQSDISFIAAGHYHSMLIKGGQRAGSEPPAERPVDYFVSFAGDDLNAGTLESPWQTLQYAVGRVIPGDTIHMELGSYPETVQITQPGASTDRITIKGNGSTILNLSIDAPYWRIETLNMSQ